MPQRMNIARGSGEFRVAIVGMGATGVAAFVHLMRALSRKVGGVGRRTSNGVTVHCFEATDNLGRGLAYSTREDCHRLNMRARSMSLFPEHPADFVDWLTNDEGGGDDCGSMHDEYVPRRRFGAYLSARLWEAEQQARRCGVEVVHHRAPVHALDKLGHTYWLTTPEARIECDAALLCVGYLPRRATEPFEYSAHFLPNPFDTARLDQIPPQSRVGILGSSLTAVDAVLTLERRAFRGEVTCFSRRRGLPKVQGALRLHGAFSLQGAPKPPALRSCSWTGITRATQRAGGQLSLDDAFQLLRDDLNDVPGAAELPHEARQWECYHVLPTLRRDVAEARAGRVAWYPALDATGAVAPLLWRALTDAAKHEFLRNYESLWGMVRHCMPLPTAERLLAMVEASTLDVRVGLQSVNTTQARTFELVCSTNRDTSRHAVDYLVDGRGAEFDISRLQSTLLDSLRRGGLLRPCPHGGVDVDFDTCALVDAHGQRALSLFFVGPLTKGVHFYTNSFEIQRDNAQRAVNAMLAGQDQTDMLPAPWSGTRSVERGVR
jgi:uncharacterized NAD(P)/FAD-binding protein YdhS